MSSNSIKYALVFFALSGFMAGCANAQITSKQDDAKNESTSIADLSTDGGVIAELQKIADAKNSQAAKDDEKLEAKLRAASRLEAKNVCIERFKESPKVIVIGAFRYDYGCHFEGVFVGSQYFVKDSFEMHKSVLDAFGWEKADQDGREKLVRLWIEKGLLAFFTVLETKPKELANFDVGPPQVTTTAETGEIKVTLWIQLPSGMRKGKGFQHFEYRFAKDGNFSSSSTLDAVVEN